MRRFWNPFKLTEYMINKATQSAAKRVAERTNKQIQSINEARDRARESLQDYIDVRN